MATIRNEITIDAPVEKVWLHLTDLELLEKYDPTVKGSKLVSNERTGIGAKRKVDMADGKNWFEEKVTVFEPNRALTYELTACSFPVHKLSHTYSFETTGKATKVRQVMEYTVRFGWLGRLLDALIMRRQSDAGIKKFFAGLKSYSESH